MRRHRRQLLARERTIDEPDIRVVLRQIRADIAAQHAERQMRCARRVSRSHAGMLVLFHGNRIRPLLLDRIAQAVQRAHARISAPRKHDLRHAARADQLIVNHIGSHADHRQSAPLLANDFMPGGERDQVRESFERNGVAVAHELSDCFLKLQNRCQYGFPRKQHSINRIFHVTFVPESSNQLRRAGCQPKRGSRVLVFVVQRADGGQDE